MKNIQISEELFFALLKYHLVETDDVLPEIKKGLEDKLEAIALLAAWEGMRLTMYPGCLVYRNMRQY